MCQELHLARLMGVLNSEMSSPETLATGFSEREKRNVQAVKN